MLPSSETLRPEFESLICAIKGLSTGNLTSVQCVLYIVLSASFYIFPYNLDFFSNRPPYFSDIDTLGRVLPKREDKLYRQLMVISMRWFFLSECPLEWNEVSHPSHQLNTVWNWRYNHIAF